MSSNDFFKRLKSQVRDLLGDEATLDGNPIKVKFTSSTDLTGDYSEIHYYAWVNLDDVEKAGYHQGVGMQNKILELDGKRYLVYKVNKKHDCYELELKNQ